MKEEHNKKILRRISSEAEERYLSEMMLRTRPQINLDGNRELVVEHHEGISEYSETRICIAAKAYEIVIEGTALSIEAMDQISIRICGKIVHLQFRIQE